MNILIPILIGFLIPTVMFIIIGLQTRKEVFNINQYYIYPKQGTSRRLYSSFMAASLSLASAILVFMEWGADHVSFPVK